MACTDRNRGEYCPSEGGKGDSQGEDKDRQAGLIHVGPFTVDGLDTRGLQTESG